MSTNDGFGPPPGQPTLGEIDEEDRVALRQRVKELTDDLDQAKRLADKAAVVATEAFGPSQRSSQYDTWLYPELRVALGSYNKELAAQRGRSTESTESTHGSNADERGQSSVPVAS
jgi:hypothetical protein